MSLGRWFCEVWICGGGKWLRIGVLKCKVMCWDRDIYCVGYMGG